MSLGKSGHATVELLMLMPIILILLALIWIVGEFLYMKQCTIAASKCLSLDERNQCYAYLLNERKAKSRPDYSSYSYDGTSVLNPIFFRDKQALFKVERAEKGPYTNQMGTDLAGTSHLPVGEKEMDEPRPDFDRGGWDYLVSVVNSARGATVASVEITYKPVAFWPGGGINIADTTYLAASDWRYDELPGGYTGYLRGKLEEHLGEFGSALGKILEWVLD
jgi:hypothetical protein